MRVPTLPSPFLAIEDRFGRAFSVAVTKCLVEVGGALEPQLPAGTNVAPATAAFLQSGGLPGEWGKGFTLGKSWDQNAPSGSGGDWARVSTPLPARRPAPEALDEGGGATLRTAGLDVEPTSDPSRRCVRNRQDCR